ncbi:MAG: sirohydrochlorin cobaltochelatase [Hornefia sp.]|nr:sirohydrochlorin cobaltochelatase [Hornefia sp.]
MEKGLLVVSFGTSYVETGKLTLDKIEADLADAFPDRKFYKAWTSKMILKKIRERDGIELDHIQQAVERLHADGIKDVLVQPTHILNGFEDNKIREEFCRHSDFFEKVRIGDALLHGEKSFADMQTAVKEIFSYVKPSEAVILVGHGTKHRVDRVYKKLEKSFRDGGLENIFITTIEGEEGIETAIPKLEAVRAERVWLAPFLIVAGDHANNDIFSDNEDSCKSVLKRAGFQVSCIKKGLGEYEEIRKIFIKHAKEKSL